MSKILFIGDPHFGSSFALGNTDPTTQLNSRLLDFIGTLDGLVDTAKAQGAQIVALSGDIFDHRAPNPTVVNAFSKSLKRATDLGLEVVMVAGNHDISRSTNSTTIDIYDHLKVDKVAVFSQLGIKTWSDFSMVFFPYKDRKQFKANTNKEAVDAIKAELRTITRNAKKPCILLAHMMIEGLVSKEDIEKFSINEIVLPVSTFDDFDLTLTGHIHNASIVRKGNKPIINLGSMEKITFGDRNSTKSTVLVDTDDLAGYKVIETPTRSLFELNFDYSGDKPHKADINDKILKDVNEFMGKNEVKGSILRLVVKTHDSDVYYVSQDRLKDKILACGVSCLAGIQITSTSSRQLRDESINENEDSKKAFKSFIGNLKDPEATKKKLLKYGEAIIEEVDGK